jgi:hypothetical protein
MSMHKIYQECPEYAVLEGESTCLEYDKIKHLIGMNVKFPYKICRTRIWINDSFMEHGLNLSLKNILV